MSRIKKAGIPLLLMTLSSLLALGLAEAGLRLFRPVQYLKPPSRPKAAGSETLYRPSRVPGLSYEMIPGRNGTFEGMQVRTNRLGFRGPDPRPRDPDLFRIVALGDSFTFGFGVREEETYPAVLERILNESPGRSAARFEVLNLGVVGYGTRDEAAVFERQAPGLDPRLVIIGYVLNDPEIDPRQSLHKYFDPPEWWRRSHVLRLLHLGWNWLEIWRFGGGDYLRYLHAPGREKWGSVEKGFRSIRRAAEPHGTRVVLVIFPLVRWSGWAAYPYRDLHLQVAKSARAEGFATVDLLPVFARYAAPDLRLSEQDDHPSPAAHALAARAIADAVFPPEEAPAP
ncbi:MAG TPA: SGNH/GDSL hydrolase family protein [Candidatus Polarisedimenticolia bacterium]|jgi:lysophospholipase L1-like esterase|nr:SGNH/GDSL hydrolase family protein [Candidatus Polarisedimenticolia bacterium]